MPIVGNPSVIRALSLRTAARRSPPPTGSLKTVQYGRIRPAASILLLIALFSPAHAFTWPWEAGFGWPRSSIQPIAPLDRPSVEQWIRSRGGAAEQGFRFAVMGDQRALADGEWQELLGRIKARAVGDQRLVCLLDTGDIVQDGRYSDQFARLREILAIGPDLPYLVCVGNHEVRENEPGPARLHTARFLSSTDSSLTAERLYYRKDIGRTRFYFLDTNDFVYGDDGAGVGRVSPQAGSRAEAQMAWFAAQMAVPPAPGEIRITIMHHPIVSSAAKHRAQARDLWRYRYAGRSIPDILADGRVDLVLSGHTHTYERFRLRRSDGREFVLVNISGRPRDSLLWFGGSTREARDLRGREEAALAESGWTDLDRWDVIQEEAMLGNGSNQFGLFAVGADGSLTMEVSFLQPERIGELAERGAVRIR